MKLNEVCTIQYGYAFNSKLFSSDGKGMPIIRIRDVTKGHTSTYTTESYTDKYIIQNGDYLIGMDGEFNIAKWNGGDALLNQRVCCIRPNHRVVPEFLFYYMMTVLKDIESKTSFVTVKHLSARVLNAIEIPQLPIDKQEWIAHQFSTLDACVKRCSAFNEELDQLVKSRFVEMFGDSDTGFKWDMHTVGEYTDCMVPGRDKPKSFSGDTPWITVDDLVVNGTTFKSTKGLGLSSQEIAEVRRKPIPIGSVIMSCVGKLGICSIAGVNMVINQQLHSFQCGSELNNVYLMHALGMSKRYMEKMANTVTVPYMKKATCNSIPIPIPPIALQEEFASFVAQVDKSQFAVRRSIEQLELLKAKLMQEYFG